MSCIHENTNAFDVFSEIGWVVEVVCTDCEEVISVYDKNGVLIPK
jgi:hypothetical protein